MRFSTNQIIIFGFVFHVLAAFFSIGYHQCDELFQVYEFAGYKLGFNAVQDLPWEYAAQMRSGIQPFIVYGFTKIFHALHVYNPFNIAFIIRLLQSLFSFFVIVKFIKVFESSIETTYLKKLFWFLTLLLWCLPYFHARFSSENFSATLFIYALCFVFEPKNQSQKPITYLFAGLLFGLAFLVRFQMLFFVAGLLTWLLFIQKAQLKYLIILGLGFCIALGLGFIFDYWLYNAPVVSWWNYLDQNLFQSKASHYGTSPFYFYFTETLLQFIPPFSLIFLIAIIFFFFKNPKNIITWLSIPFLICHFIVPHKELRFLFPLLNFVPFIFCMFLQQIETQNHFLKQILFSKFFYRFAFGVNIILLLFFTFKPADDNTPTLKSIYDFVEGNNPILVYEKTNPYNNQASLNYFRNPNISTIDINQLSSTNNFNNSYFYFEGFSDKHIIIKASRVYLQVYSNYPQWIKYFNFNGWLERANTFSIYQVVS